MYRFSRISDESTLIRNFLRNGRVRVKEWFIRIYFKFFSERNSKFSFFVETRGRVFGPAIYTINNEIEPYRAIKIQIKIQDNHQIIISRKLI